MGVRVWVAAALAAGLVVVLALLGSAGRAIAREARVAACAEHPQAVRFATVGAAGVGWTENLGFDGHGGMWVSELNLNKVVRFDAAGVATTALPLSSPGAVLRGPDGAMYAVGGDSDASNVMPAGTVVRFDPTVGVPTPTVLASGLAMTNGAAFDGAGNLYLTDGNNIARLAPTGTLDPTWRTGVSGNDGLAVSGGYLYATILTSSDSRVVRMALDGSGSITTVTQLQGTASLPTLPDDLTFGPDGQLYVTTTAGALFRVDPGTGATCLLYSGDPLTSIRFATDFAPYTGPDAFLTSEDGVVLELPLSISAATTSVPSTTTTSTPPTATSRCPAASGSLTQAGLGSLALGLTRAAARRADPHVRAVSVFDDFCVSSAPGIRAGYPSARLLRELSARVRAQVAGRVVLLLSANRRYRVRGLAAGVDLTPTRIRQARLAGPFTIGTNRWYATSLGSRALGVVQVRHGLITMVGVLSRSVAPSRREIGVALSSFG